MDLMTIGAFAERTRLSPKALRLYDRLGLLPPARTDPDSGYRFYSEDQAFIRIAMKDMGWPALAPAVDALEAWTREQRREPAQALRQVLIADQRTAAPDTPVCDLTVPLR
jgi:DNA-binding transcriptional MerR regulator